MSAVWEGGNWDSTREDMEYGGFDDDHFRKKKKEPTPEEAKAIAELNAIRNAISAGDLDGLQKALKSSGVSLDARDADGATLLSAAIEANHDQIVKFFLDAGADPALKSNNRPPLFLALHHGYHTSAHRILQKLEETLKDDPLALHEALTAHPEGFYSIPDLAKETPLWEKYRPLLHKVKREMGDLSGFHEAAENGDLVTLREYIDAGIDVDTTDSEGHTALYLTIKNYNELAAIALMNAGANPDFHLNTTDPSPLYYAAYKGQARIVEYALAALKERYKNDPDNWVYALTYLDDTGDDLAKNAQKGKVCHTVKSAIESLKVLQGDFKGFYKAIKAQDTGLVHAYLKAGKVDINRAECENYYPPLYAVARTGKAELIQLMLDHGADPDIRTAKNYSPWTTALARGHSKVAGLLAAALEEKYADDPAALMKAVNYTDNEGGTAAAYAYKGGLLNFQKELTLKAALAAKDGPFLFNAIENNDVKTVSAFLEVMEPKDLTGTYSDSRISLVGRAVYKGRFSIAEMLLEAGAPADIPSKHGNTPIILAFRDKHEAIIPPLLKALAEEYKENPKGWKLAFNRKNKKGYSAINYMDQLSKATEKLVKAEIQKIGMINGYDPDFVKIISSGDVELLKLALGHVSDINGKFGDKRQTLLHMACAEGQEAMVEILLEKGAHPDISLLSGPTPLMMAGAKGHEAVIERLLPAIKAHYKNDTAKYQASLKQAYNVYVEKGVDAQRLNRILEPVIHEASLAIKDFSWASKAARAGDTALVKKYLEAGLEVEKKWGKHKFTLLSVAAWKGHSELVGTLLDAGADPDALAREKDTPLMDAARSKDMACFEAVLGALKTKYSSTPENWHQALNRQDNTGKTAYGLAEKAGLADLMEPDLLEADQLAGKYEHLPLAIKSGDEALISKYLDKGADPDPSAEQGASPILLAAEAGKSELVQTFLTLIEKKYRTEPEKIYQALGQKPLLKAVRKLDQSLQTEMLPQIRRALTKTGQNSELADAAINGDIEIIQDYIDAGADLDGLFNGFTALFCAIAAGQTGIVKLLLDAGANPGTVNGDLDTALHQAVHQGNVKILEHVLSATREYFKNDGPGWYQALTQENHQGASPLEWTNMSHINRADRYTISRLLKTEIAEAEKKKNLPAALKPSAPVSAFNPPAVKLDQAKVATQVAALKKANMAEAVNFGAELQQLFNQASGVIAERAMATLAHQSNLQVTMEDIVKNMDALSVEEIIGGHKRGFWQKMFEHWKYGGGLILDSVIDPWRSLLGTDVSFADAATAKEADQMAQMQHLMQQLPRILNQEIDINTQNLADFEKAKKFLAVLDDAFGAYVEKMDEIMPEIQKENPDIYEIAMLRRNSLEGSRTIVTYLRGSVETLIRSSVQAQDSIHRVQGMTLPLLNAHFAKAAGIAQLATALKIHKDVSQLDAGFRGLYSSVIDPNSSKSTEVQLKEALDREVKRIAGLLENPTKTLGQAQKTKSDAIEIILNSGEANDNDNDKKNKSDEEPERKYRDGTIKHSNNLKKNL